MKRIRLESLALCSLLGSLLGRCGDAKLDQNAGAPPPLKVERVEDRNLFQVDHPERFPLTKAVEHVTTSELRATGTVNPDINRSVPVISIAAGRVIDLIPV